MMFDLASYKSQLLAFVNSMPMLDMCHLRMHKITAINSHHVLAPQLLNESVCMGGVVGVGPLICLTSAQEIEFLGLLMDFYRALQKHLQVALAQGAQDYAHRMRLSKDAREEGGLRKSGLVYRSSSSLPCIAMQL